MGYSGMLGLRSVARWRCGPPVAHTVEIGEEDGDWGAWPRGEGCSVAGTTAPGSSEEEEKNKRRRRGEMVAMMVVDGGGGLQGALICVFEEED